MSTYLTKVLSQIRAKRLRRRIEAELTDHLRSRTALYEARGFEANAAAEKAESDMGDDAEAVGARLSSVNRRFTLSDGLAYGLFVAVCLAVAYLFVLIYLAEREALFYSMDLPAQPPYWIVPPLPAPTLWVQLAVFLAQTVFLFVSVRRRYCLMPFAVAVGFAFSSRFCTSLPALLYALVTGCLGDYLRAFAYDSVFFSDHRLFLFSALLYAPLIAGALGILFLNAKYRAGNFRRRDLRVRRALVCAFAAALLLCFGATAGQEACRAAYRRADPIPAGTAWVGLIADEQPPVLAEREQDFLFFSHAYSFTFHVLDRKQSYAQTAYSKQTEPFGRGFCTPVIRRAYTFSAGRYFLLAYYEGDWIHSPTLSESELIELEPGESVTRTWTYAGVRNVLTVSRSR